MIILQLHNYQTLYLSLYILGASSKNRGGKAKGKRAEKWKLPEFNSDELKKTAAIECLLSVSDEVIFVELYFVSFVP